MHFLPASVRTRILDMEQLFPFFFFIVLSDSWDTSSVFMQADAKVKEFRDHILEKMSLHQANVYEMKTFISLETKCRLSLNSCHGDTASF